ncbi:MAG: hypothetical protein AAGC74_08525 [Verrucomicrobiota bacterium]
MKRILATIAVTAAAFLALPNTAEAGVRVSIGTTHTYVSGHASCGCPIYTKRVFRGYDCYRRPIYNYYRQPFQRRANCRSHGHRSHGRVYYNGVRNHHYGHSNAYRHSNSYRRAYRGNGYGYRSGGYSCR